MKKGQTIAARFMLLMLIVYIGNALISTLLIPYLKLLGYDELTQGWLFTWGAIASIIFQLFFGHLCDKLKSNKKVFYLIGVLYGLFSYLFFTKTSNPLLLISLWGCLVLALATVMEGTLDSWVIESDKYCLDNYGSIRAFAAFGWAIGAMLVALLVERFGYSALGYALLLLTGFSLSYSLIIPDAKKIDTGKKLTLQDTKSFLHNKDFVFLTIIFFFIFLAGNADYYTSTFKMLALGVSESQLGFLNSARAIFELPFFFFGGKLIRKFKAHKIISFIVLIYILRYLLYGLAYNGDLMIWLSILSAFTFPLLWISTKQVIDEVSPLQLRTTGQQLAAAVFGGGSGLIAPLLCGVMIKYFRYDITLYGIALSCIIPLLLLYYFNQMKRAVKRNTD